MGKQSRAKAERRRQRAAVGDLEREMRRQGVFKRLGYAEVALRSPGFTRGWRAKISLREGTEREVQDIEGAHAVALEVLGDLGVEMRDLRLTLNRSLDNRINFFCRPDATRIVAELSRRPIAREAAA